MSSSAVAERRYFSGDDAYRTAVNASEHVRVPGTRRYRKHAYATIQTESLKEINDDCTAELE